MFPVLAPAPRFSTLAAGAAILLATALVRGVAVCLRPTEVPHLVLHADYRGVPAAPVFWSRDPRVFGQVTRAVLRARESARGPRRSGNVRVDMSGNGQRSRRQVV